MSYHPDLSRDRSRTGGSRPNASDPGHDGPNEQPDQGMPNDPRLAVTSADPAPPTPAPSSTSGGGLASTNGGGLGGGAGEAGGSAAGGAAEAAAAVPIVPV
jgi:hypothetical protein